MREEDLLQVSKALARGTLVAKVASISSRSGGTNRPNRWDWQVQSKPIGMWFMDDDLSQSPEGEKQPAALRTARMLVAQKTGQAELHPPQHHIKVSDAKSRTHLHHSH